MVQATVSVNAYSPLKLSTILLKVWNKEITVESAMVFISDSVAFIDSPKTLYEVLCNLKDRLITVSNAEEQISGLINF